MQPTLMPGDVLLTRRPRRREDLSDRLAVVRLPRRPLSVKRVVHRVPEGWWVERDNPGEGVDSWLVGAIPPSEVVGVVVARLAPRPELLRRSR